jgi:mRNA interferase MazF
MSYYIPQRGDIVWINFTPQAGHEQTGKRPALVISPLIYNKKIGLAVFCPITSQIKGYPFEVAIPDGNKIRGVILADQVKSLDYNSRKVQFISKLPSVAIKEVLNKLITLVQ